MQNYSEIHSPGSFPPKGPGSFPPKVPLVGKKETGGGGGGGGGLINELQQVYIWQGFMLPNIFMVAGGGGGLAY